MRWMNEYEIEEAVRRFDPEETPNLAAGAATLYCLMQWTNRNSDGWPYWQPPARAASKLMDLLSNADRFDPQDITDADLATALRPIKAFRTKANKGAANWSLTPGKADFRIHGDPPPPPPTTETFVVKVDLESGDYELFGIDGDRRSTGTLIDAASLSVDICGAAGLTL